MVALGAGRSARGGFGAVEIIGQLAPEEMVDGHGECRSSRLFHRGCEAAPVALAEAWALGVPVVATRGRRHTGTRRRSRRVGSVPRILEHWQRGLIDVLTGTRGRTEAPRRGGRQASRGFRGGNRSVEAHLRLYKELLAEPSELSFCSSFSCVRSSRRAEPSGNGHSSCPACRMGSGSKVLTLAGRGRFFEELGARPGFRFDVPVYVVASICTGSLGAIGPGLQHSNHGCFVTHEINAHIVGRLVATGDFEPRTSWSSMRRRGCRSHPTGGGCSASPHDEADRAIAVS